MQIKSKKTEQTFVLRTDPEGKASVTIRQATFRENMLRADAFSTIKTVYANHPGERTEVVEVRNSLRVWSKEIYLTLSSASGFTNGDNKEVFTFKEQQLDMSEAAFEHVFGEIDNEDMVREIHNCVITVNPGWGEVVSLELDKNKKEQPPQHGMSEGE